MRKPARTTKRHPSGRPEQARPAQVRIGTPGGGRLRFTESLVAFVVNRPDSERRRGFRLGDWIASLDDDTLGHLAGLSEQAMLGVEPPAPAAEDLLSVSMHAAAAERRARQLDIDEDRAQAWLAALFTAAVFESFRREGLVEFDARIGIESGHEFSFRVTEKGCAAGERMGRWMN